MSPRASQSSACIPPTPREVDRDSRTAAAGTGLRRQPSFTRAEKVAEAQRLRAQGLLIREIAERMGVAKSTAQTWLGDPDLSKQRARRTRYSQPCVDCGKPTDGSGGLISPRTRCEPCKRRHAHETRYWTQETIIGALQGWADEHGGVPPVASHWLQNGTPVGYPPVPMVQREFGSWNAGLRAAGLVPLERGRPRTRIAA